MVTRAHMQPICRGYYLPPAAVEFILLKDVACKQVSFSLGLALDMLLLDETELARQILKVIFNKAL